MNATLTPRLIDSLRTVLQLRDSALEDLRGCNPAKLATDWGQDRVREVDHHNGWIAATAARLGLEPAGLIAAAA